ncbi:hypothetical protein DIJ61_33630 [Burkholderia pseudomallei]|nr:hypothetical protein DIJ61_33630 [Burkholderia pseudomallei]
MPIASRRTRERLAASPDTARARCAHDAPHAPTARLPMMPDTALPDTPDTPARTFPAAAHADAADLPTLAAQPVRERPAPVLAHLNHCHSTP